MHHMNIAAVEIAADMSRLPGKPVGQTASGSIAVPEMSSGASTLRRALSFAGPGYLVAVGYMDPGNWATSLAGGAAFGYSLLSVVLLSNVMAMLLQAAAVRLGIASGLDLAQSCQCHFSSRVNFCLWLGCEVAVVACNLAEVLGMACGLALLFKIPLPIGVCITAADVFLLLGLQRRGVRQFEGLIIALVALIGACFAVQIWWLHPSATAVAAGFVPTSQILSSPQMLYVAVGIIGATVMPHNLYLHSAIVKSRQHERCERGIRQAIRFATLDSNVALGFALFVNVGIMVLAAGAFSRSGQAPVVTLEDAYQLLSPLLGISAASTVFGVALIASGLSSSMTGTLAGQVVMEGFLKIRVSRIKRAVLTRSLAIGPAVAIAATMGNTGVGRLLVFSQVILGLQLPFAVVPLLWFTTRREHLGVHAFSRFTSIVLWSIAATLISVNLWVIYMLL
jgi:manganese transport protein